MNAEQQRQELRMKPVRVRWTAGTDRISHATARGPRTLCGLPATDERFAWPALRRCMGCSALAAELEAVR